jgi:hypothetical protein
MRSFQRGAVEPDNAKEQRAIAARRRQLGHREQLRLGDALGRPPLRAATRHEPGVLDEQHAVDRVRVRLDQALLVDDRLGGRDSDRLGRPEHVDDDARGKRRRQVLRRVRRRFRRRPGTRGRSSSEAMSAQRSDRRPTTGSRELLAVQARVADQLVAPRAAVEVVQQRARRVRVVDDLAGQPAVEVTADRRQPSRSRVVAGLLVAQPHRLGGGVRGVGFSPVCAIERILADRARERVGLARRAAVSQMIAGRTGRRPSSSATSRRPGWRGRSPRRRRRRSERARTDARPRRACFPSPGFCSAQPLAGWLIAHGAWAVALGGARLVEQQRLDALRADVNADDVAHHEDRHRPGTPSSAPAVASSVPARSSAPRAQAPSHAAPAATSATQPTMTHGNHEYGHAVCSTIWPTSSAIMSPAPASGAIRGARAESPRVRK